MDPASRHADGREDREGSGKESRFIRSKILGSFLGRERPVNSPTYDPVVDSLGQGIPQGRSLGGATSDVSSIEPDTTSPNNTTRRYVAAAVSTPHKPVLQHADSPQSASSPFYPVRLVPHLGSRSPFYFKAITRNMRVGGPVLRIGRFTDNGGYDNDDPHLFKLGFKSKVMSRAHAELWLEARSGSDASLVPGVPKLFIRDTRSSSGTFLNDTRLATAGDESRPFELKDGDLLQMGVDFQGGIENAHKSVKIRIELDCEWQTAPAIDEQISDIELLDTTLPPAPGVDLSLPASPVVDLTATHASGDEQPQLQDPITPVIHEEKSNTGLGFQVDDVPDEATLPLSLVVGLTSTRVSEDQQSQPQTPTEAPVKRWDLPQTPINAPASATHNLDQANFGAFSFASDFEVHNSQFNSAHIINQNTILNQTLEPDISLCTVIPGVDLSSRLRGTSYQPAQHSTELPESENYRFLQAINVQPSTQNKFIVQTSLCILCISMLLYYFL